MKKTGLFLLALLSLMLMGFDESKMENRAPAELERFAEQNYRDFILNIVNDSNATAFNFLKGDQDVTIGRVIPVNRLVIDRHLNIIVEHLGQWVVPVHQSGELKNAFDISESSKGKYEIVSIGYSGAFTREIAYLEEDEYYLHSRPFEFDFAYSPSKNKVRPLGDSSIRQFEENGLDPNGITKIEFIAFVKQHVKHKKPQWFKEERQSWFPNILGGIAILFLIVTLVLLKKQKRSMKG